MKNDSDIRNAIRREYRDELRKFFSFMDIPIRRKDARYSDNIRWLRDHYENSFASLVHGHRVKKLVDWLYDDSLSHSKKWL